MTKYDRWSDIELREEMEYRGLNYDGMDAEEIREALAMDDRELTGKRPVGSKA